MIPDPAGRPRPCFVLRLLALALGLALALPGARAETRFTVATYNVENYLVAAAGNREAKPEPARAKVVEHLAAIRPDVLALQEIGDLPALRDLQSRLKNAGLDLPHAELVRGYDTNIFAAVLSRIPVVRRQPHENESFLLNGRRFRTSRGIVEIDLQVTPAYRFTLLTTHLKSKRTIAAADEAEMRLQEAAILRAKVDALLARDRNANILVCGDFNDTKDSPSTRALLGRGAVRLIDTRPAERNGDTLAPERAGWDPRHVAWTHFYGKEDSYSRIDYLLLSPGMAREWRKEGTYVFTAPNWGLASDHRPVVAEFLAADR